MIDQPMRTYVCPMCGYDGFKAAPLIGHPLLLQQSCVQWGCPQCQTLYGRTVWLMETSDPRDEEVAA